MVNWKVHSVRMEVKDEEMQKLGCLVDRTRKSSICPRELH